MSMRFPLPHGVLPEPEQQIGGAVDGICVVSDDASSTVVFTIPSYTNDYKYGPAPYVGGSVPDAVPGIPTGELIPRGVRVLVVFTNGGRPWVVGWTLQP